MTGFSAAWLTLREAADHRSRNTVVTAAVAQIFSDSDSVRIVDLGCGTGSNLRALAPTLPRHQSWRLLDSDPTLLDAARAELSRWADRATADGDSLILAKSDRRIAVRFEQVDLARDLERIYEPKPDLVTASALFDLVSADWLNRLVELAARRSVPLHAALSYDGVDRWEPAHALDPVLRAAFHAHQYQDKGFGPAAGPNATSLLKTALERAGLHVVIGASPWILTERDATLLTALAQGYLTAVGETGTVPTISLETWWRYRMPYGRWERGTWTVGHSDLLAVPRNRLG